MLILHYYELMGKNKKDEEQEFFIVDDYTLDLVLDRTKESIVIIKFDDTKTLIDTYGRFPDYITLKNIVILITCIINDDGEFYS